MASMRGPIQDEGWTMLHDSLYFEDISIQICKASIYKCGDIVQEPYDPTRHMATSGNKNMSPIFKGKLKWAVYSVCPNNLVYMEISKDALIRNLPNLFEKYADLVEDH